MFADISQAIMTDTNNAIRGLMVQRKSEGGLELRGTCDTYYVKSRAQQAAMKYPGCHPLTNGIVVT